MKIDHIYVINLRSSDQDIINRLEGLGLPAGVNFTIFDAINGRKLVDGDHQENLTFDWKAADWWKLEDHENNWWARDVNAAEIGCSLSHIAVWKNAQKNGFKNILVLEEDFNTQGRGWPTDAEFAELPADWDFLYMGRRRVPGFEDIPHGEYLVKANYSYNSHAYLISLRGINKILSTSPEMDLIPADEYLPGFAGVHPRKDVNERFDIGLKMFGFNKPDLYYITQTTVMTNSIDDAFPILNASDWNAWTQKYITPVMLQKDFELMTDHIGDNIIEFPLFNEIFCEELIRLAETRGEWTMGRHEFYPTNDMLMEAIGMKEIYTRVIREFVAPLATWYWTLEGQGWDIVEDETFIIRYRPDRQGQLSIHHDYSSYTIGLKLNDEFEGGGTYFPKYKVNAMPKRVGNVFMHPGMITHRHGGRPVFSGTRYIAVSFIKNPTIMK